LIFVRSVRRLIRVYATSLPRTIFMIRLATKRTKNRKKRTLPIDAAPAAIPPKPRIAARSANTKNVSAQLSMIENLIVLKEKCF